MEGAGVKNSETLPQFRGKYSMRVGCQRDFLDIGPVCLSLDKSFTETESPKMSFLLCFVLFLFFFFNLIMR